MRTTKQLDGVEWEIEKPEKLALGQILEGPAFYINNYKLIVYVISKRECLCFSIKRIEGEFDKQLGIAFITQYRVILVNKQDYTKSYYTDGPMNYQLRIGKDSGCFHQMINLQQNIYQTIDKSLFFQFYFDVNTLTPLTSFILLPSINRLSIFSTDEDPFNYD